jgi:hypothetical protein
LALAKSKNSKSGTIRYPEDKILIG